MRHALRERSGFVLLGLALGLQFIALGCTAHPQSNRREGEMVTLSPIYEYEKADVERWKAEALPSGTAIRIRRDEGGAIGAALAAPLIVEALKWGADEINKEIDRQAEMYIGDYSAFYVGDGVHPSGIDRSPGALRKDYTGFAIAAAGTTATQVSDGTAASAIHSANGDFLIRDLDRANVAGGPKSAAEYVTLVNNVSLLLFAHFGDLPRFKLVRTIKVKKNGKSVEEEAMRLVLRPIPSIDRMAFRFEVDEFVLRYSKAKANHGINGWDAFGLFPAKESIDLDLSIVIDALWVDEDQVAHVDTLAKVELPLRSIDLPEDPTKPTEYGPKRFAKISSQWFPRVPQSETQSKSRQGSGTYVIKINAHEYDDFGERIKQIKPLVEKQKEKIPDYVKLLFPPEKKPATKPTTTAS